jgi:hypothetical protein
MELEHPDSMRLPSFKMPFSFFVFLYGGPGRTASGRGILKEKLMPKIDIKPLAELFRANVLKMLKKEGKIDDDFIAKLLTWKGGRWRGRTKTTC